MQYVVAASGGTNYPIALSVDDLGDGFSIKAQTRQRIAPRRITTYLYTALQSLVEALEHAPQTSALELTILPEDERHRVVEQFNRTQVPYPSEPLIQELFEEQVARTPDAVALVYERQSLTYAQLNRTANQLARALAELGVQRGEFIGVLMSRSMEIVVVQLAILKSGAVYVPLDPELPVERLLFMIRDCAARFVLSDSDKQPVAGLPDLQCMAYATLRAAARRHAAGNLPAQREHKPAAYVMYTSGSTGIAKGVVVPHHAVNRLVINNAFARIEPEDCIVHYSNPTFDASTFEIWSALLNGAKCIVVPQSVVLEPHRFAALCEEHRVTVMYMSVGLFNRYSEVLSGAFAGLRYLLVGGDILEPGALRRVLKAGSPQCLMNAYGPTECTTFSTTFEIRSLDEDARSIPIGRPISNAQIYVLSSRRQPVPVGVEGEIYIGGAGVALGYLNRPELTAERFVRDPFSTDPRARLYRSGDLARWREDGALEFLGRNDTQVKVRGFRVELGEVEAQLLRHDGVKQAVVVARDVSGEKSLVAYVVLHDPSGLVLSGEGLRSYVKAALPEYMVPAAFVLIEQLPLTPTGKIDRRALPAPSQAAYVTCQYESPHGVLEEKIAEIWQELLAVGRVGRHDNFFELGGHSLQGMRLVAAIDARLGVQLPVASVFRYPTVREISELVSQQLWSNPDVLRSGADEGEPTLDFDEGVLGGFPSLTADAGQASKLQGG